MVPGRILHRLASIYCSTHAVQRTIEPQLADFQHEWIAATGRPRRLVLLRGYAAFWTSLILAMVMGATRQPRRLIGEAAALLTLTGYVGVVAVLIKMSGTWVRTGTIDLDFAPIVAYYSEWHRWATWVGVFILIRLLQPIWLPRGDR